MAEVFKGRQFLVVDDEPDLREILRDELEFAGAQLAEAENGVQALALTQKQKFDAVVSDIRMPGGDGMTLARQLKAQGAGSPVVFLVTGFADFTPAEAYEIGVEGFIYKPFNLGPVIENLTRVLTEEGKRWSDVNPNVPAKALPLKGDFSELVKNGTLKVGRGGFFAVGNFVEVRKDDVIRLSLNNDVTITAVVRWLQHDESDRNLPTGIGAEILQLSPSALKLFMEVVQREAPKAYIPRK
jgi:DNA-binding response OmpR family regulator